jgi:hypothetical protein
MARRKWYPVPKFRRVTKESAESDLRFDLLYHYEQLLISPQEMVPSLQAEAGRYPSRGAHNILPLPLPGEWCHYTLPEYLLNSDPII